MPKPKLYLCMIGFGTGVRTFTEEIILLTQSLCSDRELVLIDGEPDETCEDVIRFVHKERDPTEMLNCLINTNEKYFPNYFGDLEEDNSEKSAISHPSFLGKDYPIREEEFQFREPVFFLVNRNKGPPSGPFFIFQ